MKEKVLISGGSGLVGSRLSQLLIEKGFEVSILSRTKAKKKESIHRIVWDVDKQVLDPKDLEGFDYVVNLAGAGIVDKAWTPERKKVILDSRVDSTLLLKNALSQVQHKPKAIVAASAIGYYGIETSEKIYEESDSPGTDFLAETCVAWENSIDRLSELGIPVSKVRIGLVLSQNGGALLEIAKPVKLGFGAALGSGKQYMPWIHIDDLCGIILFCLLNQKNEIFNGVAPHPVDNKSFTQTLARVLNKPLWLPNVPSFVMKMMLGSRAQLVLEGSRVSSNKTENAGFGFQHPELKEALESIYQSS